MVRCFCWKIVYLNFCSTGVSLELTAEPCQFLQVEDWSPSHQEGREVSLLIHCGCYHSLFCLYHFSEALSWQKILHLVERHCWVLPLALLLILLYDLSRKQDFRAVDKPVQQNFLLHRPISDSFIFFPHTGWFLSSQKWQNWKYLSCHHLLILCPKPVNDDLLTDDKHLKFIFVPPELLSLSGGWKGERNF